MHKARLWPRIGIEVTSQMLTGLMTGTAWVQAATKQYLGRHDLVVESVRVLKTEMAGALENVEA